MGKIVVGIDGSDSSKEALAWAGAQARRTGARLEAVIVWWAPANAYGVGVPVPAVYDFLGAARQVLQAAVHDVLGPNPDLELTPIVVEGSAAPTLLHAARDADLLVIGSRGHGAFAGMLLGSVSAHCAAHAPCPVVVVRHSSAPAPGAGAPP